MRLITSTTMEESGKILNKYQISMFKKYYSIRKINNLIEDKADITKYVQFLGNFNIDKFL